MCTTLKQIGAFFTGEEEKKSTPAPVAPAPVAPAPVAEQAASASTKANEAATADTAATAAQKKQALASASTKGQSGSILTGGLGTSEQLVTRKKSLLGGTR